MTKTIRDLEATFKEWGYSNRRSKAGAAAAWKASGSEDETPSPEENATATLEEFAALLAAELRK
jgi:hypothetical protein